MTSHACEGYSPMRAKRRQSDAKWRASVATCYDALKFVVPNVKHLSKRKISKALILQESEKHIKDLEEAISYMLDVECENKGQAVLWKEGFRWTHCSLDKLRADFSEKQRKVFHTSSHGRRCYNLLQDIKDEVFNMKADPRNLVFVRAANNVFHWKQGNEEEFCPSQISVLSMSQVSKDCEKAEENDCGETASRCPDCQSSVVRQVQTTYKVPRKGCSGVPEISAASCTVSKSQHLTLPVMTSSLSSCPVSSTPLSSPSSVFRISETLTSAKTDSVPGKVDEHCPKTNDFEKKRRISHLDYSSLMKELEHEKDQEVPSLKTPLKTVKEQHLMQDTFSLIGHEGLTAIKGTLDTGIKHNTSSDPFLGSAMPTKLTPLFSRTDNDWINKCPAKFGCARKKLNFGSHSQCDNCVVSPDVKSGTSSVISGFTPVKLPTDFKWKCETNSPDNNLTSPWKALNSPYDSRVVPQGYLDHHGSLEFGDNLLCLETMDTMDMDMDDKIPDIVTPTQTKTQEEKEKIEEGCKRKGTFPQESIHRSRPKCRKSLERFYDLPSDDRLPDDSHVVPQMETSGLWNTELESALTEESETHVLTENKQPNTLADLTHWPDFQGFFFYYRHVAAKLKDKLGSHDMQSPAVVAKVAQMWSKLTPQEKNTMSTLADIEGQAESQASFGTLSQDLEDVEVEPLDVHEFMPGVFL